MHRSAFSNRIFESVYFGGGTPTVLSVSEVESVLQILKRYFSTSKEAEFTVEANPNSLSVEQLSVFREYGVNRISVGVQSFNDAMLKFLGRLHSAEDAVVAFNRAREAGFENVSIDLISGVPGQTLEHLRTDLKMARTIAPDHVSVYCLSLDNGSRFKNDADRGTFRLPDEDTAAELYETAAEELERAGFEQYEISSFSKPGFFCRHNMNYWDRGEYLGLGPSAWSFIDGKRYFNTADVHEYRRTLMAGQPVREHVETVDAETAAAEAVMLALRTSRGLDLERYRSEFGVVASDKLLSNASRLEGTGLLKQDSNRIRLTRRGFLVANEAVNRLFL